MEEKVFLVSKNDVDRLRFIGGTEYKNKYISNWRQHGWGKGTVKSVEKCVKK